MTRSRDLADLGANAATLEKQGLTLINTTSFSGVASQDITSCFSATYESYKIIIKATNSTTAFLAVRLLSGSTPATAGNYAYYGSSISSSAAEVLAGSTTATSWDRSGSLTEQYINIELTAPFLAEVTRGHFVQLDSVNYRDFGIRHTLANSYDGFQFFPSSGTTTGTVSVYGFNK
jgi:hypothetical protein